MPSGSTRLTVASLYSLPLTVLKSSASASVADRSAKIGSVVAQHFTPTDLALLLSTWQRQNDMNRRDARIRSPLISPVRTCRRRLVAIFNAIPASQDRARIADDCRMIVDPASVSSTIPARFTAHRSVIEYLRALKRLLPT